MAYSYGDIFGDQMTTQEAVAHLTKALKEDPGYWISWEANIAIRFQDAFHEHHKWKGVHEISNIAAKRFLEALCMDRGSK